MNEISVGQNSQFGKYHQITSQNIINLDKRSSFVKTVKIKISKIKNNTITVEKMLVSAAKNHL